MSFVILLKYLTLIRNFSIFFLFYSMFYNNIKIKLKNCKIYIAFILFIYFHIRYNMVSFYVFIFFLCDLFANVIESPLVLENPYLAF